ncbi:MAG: VWA domain-containing protein, partial [Acidobacteriia bacterium]|nr:VWA domain-containing protein [Terriglobia bacterium]
MPQVARVLLLALLVSHFWTAPAQAPQANAPEVSTHDAPATFRTGVNLVLVPAVVRERDGHAVGTLRREDFELFDKNKPQVITKFSIEKPGAPVIVAVPASDPDAPSPAPTVPSPPVPERFVAYLFDDVHLTIGDLLQVKLAAARHFAEALTPTTRAAIFTTSGRTTLDFTEERDKLRQTLDKILPWTSAHSNANDCPDVSYYMADLIVNRNDQQALAAATAEALACNPPAGNDQASIQAAQAQAQALAQSTAYRELSVGDQETRLATGVLKDVVRRISVMPGSRSIVLASPGFFLTIDHRPDETELMDRAIRANVTISSLDARGLYVPGVEADASKNGFSPVMGLKSQYALSSASADSDVLAELADATGG